MNFCGLLKSSVRNHPPMSTEPAVVLRNSMASSAGKSSLVNASFTTTAGRGGGAGSPTPGEPLMALLALQLVAEPQALAGAFSSMVTSEKPNPSVTGYQPS